MIKGKWLVGLILIVSLLTLTACGSQGTSSGANYPEKAITIVAPSGAGGGWDKTARSISKVLGETKLVEKNLIVENKPGGGGAVFMAQYATKEKKNDYMLFVSSPPILINNLKKEGNSPYGYQDTVPLAQLTKDYGAYVVKADSPYQSIEDVIQDLKADPTQVTVAGGSAPGSMDHVVAILPAYKSGIDPKSVKYVSYDGGGEAIAALLGDNADMIATDASSMPEYLKSGKVRVLAVSAPERIGGELKDVPTLMELGIDTEFTIWRGIFGPKEMSAEAKQYWDETLQALAEHETWLRELELNGWETDFKNSTDFIPFLESQESLIKDILTSLDMAK